MNTATKTWQEHAKLAVHYKALDYKAVQLSYYNYDSKQHDLLAYPWHLVTGVKSDKYVSSNNCNIDFKAYDPTSELVFSWYIYIINDHVVDRSVLLFIISHIPTEAMQSLRTYLEKIAIQMNEEATKEQDYADRKRAEAWKLII